MDDAQRLITNGNVDRMFSRIIVEPDAKQRRVYCDILITEENRFASLSERLEIARNILRRFDALIERQKSHLETVPNSERRELTQDLLRTFAETRRLFAVYCEAQIQKDLDNGKL